MRKPCAWASAADTSGAGAALLPPAPLPEDMQWATSNPRVADALARWAAAVERETVGVVSPAVKRTVQASLENWHGEQMPISRSWVNADVGDLREEDQAIASLAIVLAKAPYQVDGAMAEAVLAGDRDEARFIRILAWASFTGARRFVQLVAARTHPETSIHRPKTIEADGDGCEAVAA